MTFGAHHTDHPQDKQQDPFSRFLPSVHFLPGNCILGDMVSLCIRKDKSNHFAASTKPASKMQDTLR